MTDLEETVIMLRIQSATHGEQLKSVDAKIDALADDVKEIKNSVMGDLKASNKWMRSTLLKVIAVIVAGGIGGSATTAVVQAMTKPPVEVEQAE